MAGEPRSRPGDRRPRTAIVDCDVHHALPNPDTLKPYLAPRWHGEYGRLAGRRPDALDARRAPGAGHLPAGRVPAGGGTPGSSLELMQEQYLDLFDVRFAILNPLEILSWPTHGELSLALTSALNEWTAAEWLDRDDRLRATIAVPIEDPLVRAAGRWSVARRPQSLRRRPAHDPDARPARAPEVRARLRGRCGA